MDPRPLLTIILSTLSPFTPARAAEPQVIDTVLVYNQPGRFAGWPANNGIWNWNNEIVVGFTLGYHKESSGHTIDPDRPATTRQARSTDGGLSWTIETPSFLLDEATEHPPQPVSSPINFSNPGFAARFRDNRFYHSPDRCRTWLPPSLLPAFGRPGLLARTDYLVEGPNRLTAFITAEKEGGGEGQPLCIRTSDGGQTWQLVGWITDQPPAGYGYAIMPATLPLANGSYLSFIRRGAGPENQRKWWIEACRSADQGRSWQLQTDSAINNAGNPASLTQLKDGRIALVYGWRHPPYGIRARLSANQGQTWGPEIILRKDGHTWDLGYPRTIQRPDGNLVTVYYFNDSSQQERYIAATVWSPGAAD